MEYIKIAQVVKPFGIKGELKVYPYTGFIEDRFKENQEVYLLIDGVYKPFKVAQANLHKGLVNVRFKGYTDINQVECFRGIDIYFDKTKIKSLNKGEYYIFELKGLKVFTDEGLYLGNVFSVDPTGTHNNLRIQKEDGKFLLIPNIPHFVKEVNLNDKIITVKLIEGFL